MRMHRRDLGPKFSEGARQMWIRLEKLGITPEELTRRAGWSRGMALRYLYGDRRPDRQPAGKILEILGVEPGLFDREPTRGFTPPAARAA